MRVCGATAPERGRTVASVCFGIGLAGAGAVVANAIATRWPAVSETIMALGLGMAIGVVVDARWPSLRYGLRFGSRHLLRAGVALAGFRIAGGDLVRFGPAGIAVVLIVVCSGLTASRLLGRYLGLPRDMIDLLAVGTSVCGASAVAAAGSVVDADEDDLATCIGLVTLCGTAAMLGLPAIAQLAGVPADVTGRWLGLSIHDVGQVVAAATAVGPGALSEALVSKLARVTMLVPIVALLSAVRRLDRKRATGLTAPSVGRTMPVPWYVVLFLVAMALRTCGAMSLDAATRLTDISGALLTVAIVAIGSELRPKSFAAVGWRPAVTAGGTSMVLAVASGLGVSLLM